MNSNHIVSRDCDATMLQRWEAVQINSLLDILLERTDMTEDEIRRASLLRQAIKNPKSDRRGIGQALDTLIDSWRQRNGFPRKQKGAQHVC